MDCLDGGDLCHGQPQQDREPQHQGADGQVHTHHGYVQVYGYLVGEGQQGQRQDGTNMEKKIVELEIGLLQ